MTTIAIDREARVVAFDSRITSGNEIVYSCPKVWHSAKHPVIYAGAGSITSMHAIGHYLDHTIPLPWEADQWFDNAMHKTVSDASLAIIHADARVYIFEHPHYYPVTSRFVTLGSGSQAASAAMLCGRTAAEAVEVACQVDSGSGLPVNVWRFEDIPPLKPKRRR